MEHPPHPLQPLERDLDALRAAWADAMPAFGALPGGAQVELEQMSDAGLVGVADLIARARRDADALLARVGNEIARRSGREFGDTGLAKKQGFHNAARLLAATTGGSRSEASRLIAVGAATAERQSFTGEYRPAAHPHVAAALGLARSAPRPRPRSPRCSTASALARIRLSPTSPRGLWSNLPSTLRSISSCAACARQRRDSIPTESNREKTRSRVSDPSRCSSPAAAAPACAPRSRDRRADQGRDRGSRERCAAATRPRTGY